MRPFQPNAATVNIDVSSSSQRVQVALDNGVTVQVRVMNNGTATAWINWGDDTVTATTTSGMPVGPGAREVITLSNPTAKPLNIAAIAAASTGKIHFTPGSGGV